MLVTLDRRYFNAKPGRYEVGGIQNRLKREAASDVSADGLIEHVRRGGTFNCACFVPTDGRKYGSFRGLQLLALDFDNDVVVKGPDGKPVVRDKHVMKRPLVPGEAGYLDPLDAIDRAAELGLSPLCWYFSFSSKPDHLKYHIVFDLGVVVEDEGEAKSYIDELHKLFPEADHTCKNVDRTLLRDERRRDAARRLGGADGEHRRNEKGGGGAEAERARGIQCESRAQAQGEAEGIRQG